MNARWILLLPVLLAGCSSFERQLSRAFLHPEKEIHAKPSDHGLAFEEVVLPAGSGVQIHGWFVPSRTSAGETVVFFHGDDTDIGDYFFWVCFLHDAGFHVFLYDYPGFGRSGGEARIGSLFASIDPVMDHVMGRPDVDRDRIALFGISLGSIVALRAASRYPVVAGVAVENCASPDANIAAYFERERYGWFSRWLATAMLDAFVLPWGIEPTDSAASYPGPILLMHGERDARLDVDASVATYTAAPDRANLWIMPGTGHAPDSIETFEMEYPHAVTTFFRAVFEGSFAPIRIEWTCRPVESGHATTVTLGLDVRDAPVQVALRTEDGAWSFRNIRIADGAATVRHESPVPVTAVAAHAYHHVVDRDGDWKPAPSVVIAQKPIRADLLMRLNSLKFAARPRLAEARELARHVDSLGTLHPRLEAELVPLFLELGIAFEEGGKQDHDSAIRWYERGLRAVPDYPKAHFWFEGRVRFLGFQHPDQARAAGDALIRFFEADGRREEVQEIRTVLNRLAVD